MSQTSLSDHDRKDEDWSPFVVNEETYAEHKAKKNRTTGRKLPTVPTCDSSEIVDPKAKVVEVCLT